MLLAKIAITTPKIYYDLCFSHRPYFFNVFCLSLSSEILYGPMKNLYFRTKNPSGYLFFTQFVLSHASGNTRSTSRNVGGTDAYGSSGPPPQILGDRPPSPPNSPPMLRA